MKLREKEHNRTGFFTGLLFSALVLFVETNKGWKLNVIVCHSIYINSTCRQNSWDLKQPRRVCGRRREKTSQVWVENVVQSGKNKCLSKLPSRLVAEVGRLHWMASFKEIRELLLYSVENNAINEEEFFLLSEGFKSVNRLLNEKAWIESNKTELVLLSYTFYRT